MRGTQLPQNFFQHSIDLFQRVVIPKADYAESFQFKAGCSHGIADSLLGMLPAIEFHYQHLLKADEINNVRWNRMLPPKLESAQAAVFQLQPKPQLGVGR